MVRRAFHQTETIKTVVPLSLFEEMANDPELCDMSLNDATRKQMAKMACDKYARVIAGEINYRSTRPATTVCQLGLNDVIFAMSDRYVRIPYLGLCRFIYNNKVMLKVEDLITTKAADFYSLGYWHQRPTLIVHIKSGPRLKPIDYSGQKLVKVSKTDRRKLTLGTAPASNPERK